MASDLLKLQQLFAASVPRMIDMARVMGYEVTLGDAYRDPRCPYGNPKSLHRQRLAIDLNLFMADGTYIDDDTGHRELHEFWAQIGGAPMIEDDPCHYSFAFDEMR